MGGGGQPGGGQSGNSASVSAPWGGQKPYLKDLYARASGLSRTPLQMYPGELLAAPDQATLSAEGAAEARARAGSSNLRDAQSYNDAVLRGDYLGSNPFSDAQYDQIAGGITRNFNNVVIPGIGARFGTAGMLGSSGADSAFGEAGRDLGLSLSDAATNFYGNQYNAERGYQENARAAAPGLAQADYNDINALGDVGAARTSRAQAAIDEAAQRFDFAQNEPWQRLGQFQALLGGVVPGSTRSAYNNAQDLTTAQHIVQIAGNAIAPGIAGGGKH